MVWCTRTLLALDAKLWLPYPDVRDENKHYIENGTYTIEEPWKRTAEYRIYSLGAVHTTAPIATSPFSEMPTKKKARNLSRSLGSAHFW